MKDAYQIIYFNGPSSAGKTTLARALQNSLNKPFLVVGIDQVIFMMPDKVNTWDAETNAIGFSSEPVSEGHGPKIVYKVRSGPFGKQMVQALKDIVITLAKSGQYIIIDDVSIGKKEVDAWREALKDFKVLWVGLTAPLSILEERERIRGDRKIGLARWQAEHVHVGVTYDIMIDTSEKTVDENVVMLKHHIE